jgi:hypothetical protein
VEFLLKINKHKASNVSPHHHTHDTAEGCLLRVDNFIEILQDGGLVFDMRKMVQYVLSLHTN